MHNNLIPKLVDLKLLETDSQKSNLPGKYYKLTDLALEIINSDLIAFLQGLETEIKKVIGDKDKISENIPRLSHLISGMMTFSKIMSNIWLANLEPLRISMKDGVIMKNDAPLGSALLHIDTVNVEDEEDDNKIKQILNKSFSELDIVIKGIEEKYKTKEINTTQTDELFSNANRFRLIYAFSAVFDRKKP